LVPRRRYFTLDEANALVPELQTRFTGLLQIVGQLKALRDRIEAAGFPIAPEGMGADPDKAPVHVRRALGHFRGLYETMGDELHSLERMGAQVKDLETGLVDFFTLLDGKDEALLCWRLGERRIDFWHDLESGFRGRRPVAGRTFFAERKGIERHAKP
jgi:hypothetical protein